MNQEPNPKVQILKCRRYKQRKKAKKMVQLLQEEDSVSLHATGAHVEAMEQARKITLPTEQIQPPLQINWYDCMEMIPLLQVDSMCDDDYLDSLMKTSMIDDHSLSPR